MATVGLNKVSKTFKVSTREEVHAVRNVSLTVAEGEFLVLVGPSGSGKSTILRMIAGLEKTASGTISIGGRAVNDIPPRDRDVAMVFQNFALHPHMTVYENVALGLKLRNVSKHEIERLTGEALDVLGLANQRDRFPNQLSGGQKQRVAVGRAIVRKPGVFLLDEPLSNLDASMRSQMRMELVKLHRRLGTTVIYVTHDQLEAMSMGDRIAVIKDGAIQQAAEPLRLYHEPVNLFVARFIGSPPMNLFSGSLVERGTGIWFEEAGDEGAANGEPLALRLAAPTARSIRPYLGKGVSLGLRPEDIGEREGLNRRKPDDASGYSAGQSIVEFVEPLGAETHLHGTAGLNSSFTARMRADYRARLNERVELSFNMRKAHLFDPSDGARIG